VHRFRAPPQNPVRTAAVLAAGLGSRLGPAITGRAPKALVKVGATTLLERQVAAFAAVGVDHVVLVVGHAAEQVAAASEGLARRHGVRFSFVVNEDYASTNTVVSQYLARRWLAEGAWCANGDVLFGAGLLRRLQASGAAAALAVDVKRCGEEEVKVVVDGGRVLQISKALAPEVCLGEFVGVARYTRAAGARFAEALEVAVERQGRRRDYFEVALAALAPDLRLDAVPTEGEPVVEIDTPDDYHRAVTEVAPRLEVA
jgi:choline kinase